MRIPALAVLLSLAVAAPAQQLLRDDFAYAGPLTSNGWFAHSSGGQRTIVSFGDYAILQQATGAGEDINRSFPQIAATTTIWASFHVRIPSGSPVNPGTSGLYFAHFKDGTTGFRARTGVLAPAAGGDFRIALHADNANIGAGVAWPTDLAFDTDYTIVVNYTASTGVSELWIDPVSQASPSISHTGTLLGQFMSGFAWRQSDGYTGLIHVDSLIVGLTYDDVAGSSSYATFGSGCASSVGVPSNVGAPSPRIGRTTSVVIGNVPLPVVGILLIGTSNTFSPSFGPLPLDLTFLGAPGCIGRVSDDVLQLFTIGFSSLQYDLAIPNDTFFVGLELYTQALVFENVNPLGIVVSDAAAFSIGN